VTREGGGSSGPAAQGQHSGSSGPAAQEKYSGSSGPAAQEKHRTNTMIWVDAGNGAAGDMLLAALLDAGADLEAVRAGLRGLGTEAVDVELAPVRRHGLRAALATVRAPRSQVTRNLGDITALIARAALPADAREFALAVFGRLARAEARVHGVDIPAVHFHEVGALDAIADVVGCALALHSLNLLHSPLRVVSAVAVGSGTSRGEHGPLPVPVPATMELLVEAAAPVRSHQAQMELCTPTGAALLATLATSWGPVPDCVPLAVGVGAGTADPQGHPNVLRVLVGQAAAAADWVVTGMCRVDATIDDLDPRLWPDVLESLRGSGAADAWCTPALMRKGRPGHVLSAITDTDRLDAVCRAVFELTTTLGLRVSALQRRSLRRDQVSVQAGGQEISVKRGHLGDRVVTVQPEYDDVRAAAARTGRPIAELLAEARAAAQD
jgi:pyridinium-3,5-bisthiocarboxylic acid mononucleotide nickel chelatase